MGSEILYPIMPAFLTMLGASRATIGVIEGLAEGLPSIIKLFSGAVADRVRNRKWLVLTGCIVWLYCLLIYGMFSAKPSSVVNKGGNV